jgi:hypothetical protein
LLKLFVQSQQTPRMACGGCGTRLAASTGAPNAEFCIGDPATNRIEPRGHRIMPPGHLSQRPWKPPRATAIPECEMCRYAPSIAQNVAKRGLVNSAERFDGGPVFGPTNDRPDRDDSISWGWCFFVRSARGVGMDRKMIPDRFLCQRIPPLRNSLFSGGEYEICAATAQFRCARPATRSLTNSKPWRKVISCYPAAGRIPTTAGTTSPRAPRGRGTGPSGETE